MTKLPRPLVIFILLAIVATFILGALAPAVGPAAPNGTNQGPVAAANLEVNSATAYSLVSKMTTGVTVGSTTAEKTIYVVFDPKCPHCGHLWRNTKELHQDYRFVWIPVAFLSRASLAEGAALLEGGETVMDGHEAAVADGKPSTLRRPGQDALDKVTTNTKTVGRIKVEGVPILFHKTADGQYKVASGGLSAAEVKALLSL